MDNVIRGSVDKILELLKGLINIGSIEMPGFSKTVREKYVYPIFDELEKAHLNYVEILLEAREIVVNPKDKEEISDSIGRAILKIRDTRKELAIARRHLRDKAHVYVEFVEDVTTKQFLYSVSDYFMYPEEQMIPADRYDPKIIQIHEELEKQGGHARYTSATSRLIDKLRGVKSKKQAIDLIDETIDALDLKYQTALGFKEKIWRRSVIT